MKKALMFVLFLLLNKTAFSVSFDCAKAKSFAENAICANKQLSNLDDQLAWRYKSAGAANQEHLKAEQNNWLKEVRDKCQDVACLESAYSKRIEALEISHTIIACNRIYDDSAECTVCKTSEKKVINKDNSILIGTGKFCPNPNTYEITVSFLSHAGDSPKVVLHKKITQQEAFGADFDDIDKDGIYEVDFEGEGGMVNFDHTIYKLNKDRQAMSLFLEDNYANLTYKNGFLFAFSRGSCCSYSWNIYLVTETYPLVEMYRVDWEATTETNNEATCTVTKVSNGKETVMSNPPKFLLQETCNRFLG